MKKSLLYLFALICSVGMFTACSDDDDEVKYPIDSEIAGIYKGNLTVEVNGTPFGGPVAQKITLSPSSKGNNQIALSLKNFAFMGFNVGDIEVDPCMVKAIDGGYSFEGMQTLDLIDPLGNCPVSISGTVKGSNINIQIGVEVASLGQTVKALFAGQRLTGNESSEAKIVSFTFDSDIVTEQPVIDEENGKITFRVSADATEDDLKALIPTIEVSSKATITPASGTAQNFNNPVTYTVVAEDGSTKTYTVSVSGREKLYTFEEWTVDKSQSTAEYQYPIIGSDYKNPEWATCNQAVMLLESFMGPALGMEINAPWPINSTDEVRPGTSGTKALEIVSVDTQGGDLEGIKFPKVTAGTAFLGSFNAWAAMSDNPMATTAFGIAYTEQPLEVKGFFSYTPGEEFYNSEGKLDNTAKDACSISAVLYEVENYKETLDGGTIYTSEKIVAQAMYTYDKKTDGYQPFDLQLEYKKEYDPQKKYKFAVIFSASKDGASYNAAVGSRLLIDDVTIVTK